MSGRPFGCEHEVLVLDVDGYIGESTAREIAYAEETGKLVRYLSKEPTPTLLGAPVEEQEP